MYGTDGDSKRRPKSLSRRILKSSQAPPDCTDFGDSSRSSYLPFAMNLWVLFLTRMSPRKQRCARLELCYSDTLECLDSGFGFQVVWLHVLIAAFLLQIIAFARANNMVIYFRFAGRTCIELLWLPKSLSRRILNSSQAPPDCTDFGDSSRGGYVPYAVDIWMLFLIKMSSRKESLSSFSVAVMREARTRCYSDTLECQASDFGFQLSVHEARTRRYSDRLECLASDFGFQLSDSSSVAFSVPSELSDGVDGKTFISYCLFCKYFHYCSASCARGGITFFANSLLMKMPNAPRIQIIISFR
ncbi:unnamed protein product [Cochlearia groenlandica]